jgi:hypothetical protein
MNAPLKSGLPLATRQSRPQRIPFDFYPTPPAAVRALLSVEDFDGDIWEPACGNGQIARTLIEAGYHVVATDLVDHGYGVSGQDFLASREPLAKHIVTNPPYGFGLADQFVRKHVLKTGGTVAMLLNVSSLCHRARTPCWRKTPPAVIYAIDSVVCWPEHLYGPAPAGFTKQRYCWAVWKPGHTGCPRFWWLSAADFEFEGGVS